MSIIDKLKKTKQEETSLIEPEKMTIYLPIMGEVISLSQIKDGVFSEEILGKGCGIQPAEDKVYAPFNGKILQIAETNHAIGIVSEDGIEILIHIGLDTVEMNGKGFNLLVKEGDKVRCGQLLMTFSIPEIKKKGFSLTTAAVITNTDEYSDIEILAKGNNVKLEKLMLVKK